MPITCIVAECEAAAVAGEAALMVCSARAFAGGGRGVARNVVLGLFFVSSIVLVTFFFCVSLQVLRHCDEHALPSDTHVSDMTGAVPADVVAAATGRVADGADTLPSWSPRPPPGLIAARARPKRIHR